MISIGKTTANVGQLYHHAAGASNAELRMYLVYNEVQVQRKQGVKLITQAESGTIEITQIQLISFFGHVRFRIYIFGGTSSKDTPE